MSALSRYIGSNKRQTPRGPEAHVVEDVQDWENHLVLRVPPDIADRVNAMLATESSAGREELAIQLTSPDMRHATIRLGQQLMSAKIFDLPCPTEVMKTIDKKNMYKVADLSQIMVCSPGLEPIEPTPAAPPPVEEGATNGDAVAKSIKKEQRQWQYPHGLTPPMKSARRRRFRKTKKKKYMDAPEVEKELKRLLRADLEADSIRWEIVSAEDKKKDPGTVMDSVLFGDKVTSSEDEEGDSRPVPEKDDD